MNKYLFFEINLTKALSGNYANNIRWQVHSTETHSVLGYYANDFRPPGWDEISGSTMLRLQQNSLQEIRAKYAYIVLGNFNCWI